MYVLNERILTEELLSTHVLPDDLYINYLIMLLAKYYYDVGESLIALTEKIKEELLKFKITGYQEYLYAKKIFEISNIVYTNPDKRGFKELDYIPIYQSDIDSISTLPSDRHKKMLFTLIVNARYANADGWTNKKTLSSVTKMLKETNISGSSSFKDEILYDLYKDGYISYAKANMNQNIRINQFEHDDVIAYKVVNFKNLGNQYIGNFKPGYMMCEKCGKIVRKSNNRRKYCKHCYEEIDREKAQERMAKIRNSK